ncbi:MAG: polysaccharide biosynthesis/export family protein [Winogradskyella sp.]
MKNSTIYILILMLVTSCSTKKGIHYLQDVEDFNGVTFDNTQYTIQPNDILKIDINAPDYESADGVFNKKSNAININLGALKLEGYLVSSNFYIKHSRLGDIYVKNKTVKDLELEITNLLRQTNQLKFPIVSVRVINAKFTVSGEVNRPGTFEMIEGRITLLQALGYAGDLRINGVRDDITIIRQQNGKQIIGHVDLTSASFTTSPFNYIMQNDVIYVKPNGPRTKSAGYIGSFGSAIAVVSSLLSLGFIISNIIK